MQEGWFKHVPSIQILRYSSVQLPKPLGPVAKMHRANTYCMGLYVIVCIPAQVQHARLVLKPACGRKVSA